MGIANMYYEVLSYFAFHTEANIVICDIDNF